MAPVTGETCVPTGSLVVTASIAPGASLVTYSISSSEDGTLLKVARFNELEALHMMLIKEVPTFGGRLPRKTWMHHTSADFVESRRKDIETYLRLAATNESTRRSTAWICFYPKRDVERAPVLEDDSSFSLSYDASAETAAASALASAEMAVDQKGPTDGDTSEDEACALSNSMSDEMKALMARRRNELREAEQTQMELEGILSSGEKAVKATEQDAQKRASLEAEAGARLRAHLVNLEGLDAELAAKQLESRDTELRQLELAKRLSEELSVASSATKKVQVRFETARRARMEAAAQFRSHLEAAGVKKAEAEAQNAAAIERLAAMSAVLLVLQERAKARRAEVKSAERDRDARRAVNLAAVADSSEAESLRRQAEAEANAAAAAVTSHIGDAARRCRAHEVEVRRARERVTKASTLRDMRTRGLVMGDDRAALESAGNAASVAADILQQALKLSTQLRDETEAKDQEKLRVLETAAERTSFKLKDRERVAVVFAARVNETERAVRNTSDAYAAADAALKAVEEELENIKQRVQGPLAKHVPECAAHLEDTLKALRAIKKNGVDDQTPLRHTEDAEVQLLKSHQQAEEPIVQSLDEAQMVAAEAHEDAVEVSDDHEDSVVKSFESSMDVLVKSAAARHADHERNAKRAVDAHNEVLAAFEAAKQELDTSWPSSDDSMLGNVRRAALEARLSDLKEVTQEKEAASTAASAAMAAGKEELRELECRQESARIAAQPLEKFIREELRIVRTWLEARLDEETAILAAASERKVTWTKEKETLDANLHRAQLQAAVAEEGLNIASGLVQTLCH
jgi:hypothetical protein